jgi:hypothetical protein
MKLSQFMKFSFASLALLGLFPGFAQAALVGHWTFDESPAADLGAAGDSSGSTLVHHGVIRASTTNIAVAGQIGGAFQFTDSAGISTADDGVLADLGADFVLGANPATLTFWMNPDAPEGNSQNFLFAWGQSSGGQNVRLSMESDSNGGFKFLQRHQAGAPAWEVPASDPDLTVAGGWYHVAVTIPVGATTVSSVQVYMNGALMNNTVTDTDTLDVTAGTGGTNLSIGGNFDGVNGFEGQMDDVGFWDSELSPVDIKKIYDGGRIGLDLQQSLAVPEPSSIVMLALGLGGFIVRRRR